MPESNQRERVHAGNFKIPANQRQFKNNRQMSLASVVVLGILAKQKDE